MKCIRFNKDKSVRRVDDRTAHQCVKNKEAVYVPKHVWKEEVRDKDE